MTDKIIIKKASIEDCEAISLLFTDVVMPIPYYNELAKSTELSKFKTSDLVEKIKDDENSVLIATLNNEIAAFCFSRFDDNLIWLEWFGIHKKFRGKGISKLLLNELEETVAVRKCHKIWCDCRTTNVASIHILTNQGYRQIVTIPNHWFKQDFILWEKPLFQ